MYILVLMRIWTRKKSDRTPAEVGGRNVLLTTYFCRKTDPQRKEHAPCNDFSYIRPWYESVAALGLEGVIFHDGMSDCFVERYETDRIRFEMVPPESFRYSLNDYRFFIYLDYLRRHPDIGYVFMTDGNDVKVVTNPFPQLRSDRLYVGSEPGDARTNRWMQRRITLLNRGSQEFAFRMSRWRTNPIFNAGILGGPYHLCVEFLDEMVRKFESLDPHQQELNLNMAVFNHTVYQRFRRRLVTGEPLHSVYKEFQQNRDDVWFIHK